MKTETLNIINNIYERIEETRKTIYREELIQKAITSFAMIMLLGTILVLIESLAGFDSAIRTILVKIFFGVSILIVGIVSGKSLLRFLGIIRSHSDKEIARIIGGTFEKISDRLENALDLSDVIKGNDGTLYSTELIEVSLEHFDKSTVGINFSDAISFTSIKQLGKIISAVTAVLIITITIPHSPFGEAANRLMHFNKDFTPPQPFTLQVNPGSKEIVKGEMVDISVRIIVNDSVLGSGKLPEEIFLRYREEGVSKNETITLKKDSTGIFDYRFASLNQTFHYSVHSGEIKSDEFTLTVSERPFVRSLVVGINPPQYSKLAHQTLEENVGDVLALSGTRIDWNILPSKDVAKATIVFKEGSEVALRKNGDKRTTSFTVTTPTSYYIELEDENGLTNQNIIEYKIEVIPDVYPTIEIIFPGKNVEISMDMKLLLQFKLGDDFGISKLALSYRLVHSKFTQDEKENFISIPVEPTEAKETIVSYDWDLSSLQLVPEDVVEYHAEVEDNDPFNGPKKTKSATFLIHLPSLEEIFADADKSHDASVKSMEQAMKDAEEIKKDLDELSRDMKKNQQMDWQKQKKAEEIAKKYQEIQKNIESVNKAVEEMTKELNKNNTLSPQTLEKYLELQKTMQEMNTPEFREAMKKMQDAMQQANPEQLRQAMEQAQFSEEQFRQSIERTMNLLKRIQIEQKVDEMIKRSEEIQKQQNDIKNETQKLGKNDSEKANELAKKQDEANKKLDDLQKELSKLREKMEEFPKEMPLNKMNDAEAAAKNKKMQSAMKQSSQQLRTMQLQQASQVQEEANEGLEKMTSELSQMQEQLLSNQQQEAMNGLRKAMQDLLQLSQKQERLKNQSQSLDPNSQQFKDVAQQQQNLQGDLGNIANQLSELSQKSFVVTPEMGKQIGKAMGQMQQSMGAVEGRNGNAASTLQGDAMASLNKAATQMQSAMQSMQQQGRQGGGSLMQQLRGMAQQQQSINMQTQQMGQSQGMSQQQMQEMGRLAKQQDAVRKSLEQMQKEAEQAPEKNKVMGDLQKIADEMKEVVQQLEQQNMNPNTVRQQERILSRLLQAQRSMRERDFEQKRKSSAGTTPPRRVPEQLTLEPKQVQRQQDLQRAIDAGYSKDYLEIIRKYYEALEKNN